MGGWGRNLNHLATGRSKEKVARRRFERCVMQLRWAATGHQRSPPLAGASGPLRTPSRGRSRPALSLIPVCWLSKGLPPHPGPSQLSKTEHTRTRVFLSTRGTFRTTWAGPSPIPDFGMYRRIWMAVVRSPTVAASYPGTQSSASQRTFSSSGNSSRSVREEIPFRMFTTVRSAIQTSVPDDDATRPEGRGTDRQEHLSKRGVQRMATKTMITTTAIVCLVIGGAAGYVGRGFLRQPNRSFGHGGNRAVFRARADSRLAMAASPQERAAPSPGKFKMSQRNGSTSKYRTDRRGLLFSTTTQSIKKPWLPPRTTFPRAHRRSSSVRKTRMKVSPLPPTFNPAGDHRSGGEFRNPPRVDLPSERIV